MELIFFHSDSYDGVLWICDQNNVGNSTVFYLLLSTFCTVPRNSLKPSSKNSGDGQEVGRGHSRDS